MKQMKKGSKTSKVKSRASAFLCAVFAAVIAGATVFSACADSAKSFNHKSPCGGYCANNYAGSFKLPPLCGKRRL